jgi:hypothetical protein
MEAGGSYDQTDAEGFLRIMGLPVRVIRTASRVLVQYFGRTLSIHLKAIAAIEFAAMAFLVQDRGIV